MGPAVILRNSMTLHVRVPVLSENTYSTCPSSSFKFDDCTRAGMSIVVSYILISYDMKAAWENLTISRVTSNEIGTKFLETSNNHLT